MDKSRIEVLDGLRGYAILVVIWHHLFSPSLTPPGTGGVAVTEQLALLPWTLLANGWLGVNLFFVLSGFVLFLPYMDGARELEGWADLKAYYVRRARRLLPLYYINLLACFLLVKAPESLWDVALMLTATFNFTQELWSPSYNWVLWSLGIEIWFSVVFPAVLVAYKRLGMARLVAGTLVVSLLVRLVGNDPAWNVGSEPYLGVIKDSLIGRLDDFVVGMGACYLWRGATAEQQRGWSSPVTLLGGAVFVLVASMAWDHVALGRAPLLVRPFINDVLLVGLFLVVMFLLHTRSRVVRFVSANGLLQTVGLMCYSLYVWHGVALIRYARVFTVPKVIGYLVFLFAFSYLSFRYIEFGHVRELRLPLQRSSDGEG